jgi:hypothetical protein
MLGAQFRPCRVSGRECVSWTLLCGPRQYPLNPHRLPRSTAWRGGACSLRALAIPDAVAMPIASMASMVTLANTSSV